jgi:hypothetical protein
VPTSNGQVVVFQESKQGIKEGLYQGLSEGTKTIGGFFSDEAAATKPLLRVAAGTPMGLFFTQSVQDTNKTIPNAPYFSNASGIASPNTQPLISPSITSDGAKKSTGPVNQAP